MKEPISRNSVLVFLALPFLLAGCAGSSPADQETARQRYLEAKDRCVAQYPASLARQSDCRTNAANEFIRPYYRYGDLMTRLQQQRKVLAVRVDNHTLSRREYDRQIARAERDVAREEQRRNSGRESAPLTRLFDNATRWLAGPR